MNAIGFVRPGFPSPTARPRLRRVETVTLASSISIVALVLATPLHLFANVGEAPLVIGTILGASIAGWINAFLPSAASDPDGGQRGAHDRFDADLLEGDLMDGDVFDGDVFDRAA